MLTDDEAERDDTTHMEEGMRRRNPITEFGVPPIKTPLADDLARFHPLRMSHVSSALYGEHTITNRRKRWRNNKRSSSWQVVRVWASTRLPGTWSRTRFSVRFRQESSSPSESPTRPGFLTERPTTEGRRDRVLRRRREECPFRRERHGLPYEPVPIPVSPLLPFPACRRKPAATRMCQNHPIMTHQCGCRVAGRVG